MSNSFNNKEHAFTIIEKDLKAGNIPRLVLLCGKEEYLIDWYSQVIINSFVSKASRVMDLITLDEAHMSIEEIKEGLETLSIMSERKIVYLEDFQPAEGRTMRSFTDSDIKELVECFKDIPEGSMLLMTASGEEGNKSKKNAFHKAVAKYGRVYDFTHLNDRQLKGFIEKRLRASGKDYTSSAIGNIMASSGYGNRYIEYNLFNLENDLKKIIAYAHSNEITAADVADVLSASPENNVFAMVDAIGKNRKDEAFRLLHTVLDSGTPVFRLLGLITSQIELLLMVKELKDEGRSFTEIHRQLGGNEFRIKKAAGLTAQYSTVYLKGMLALAYQVDENIKSGLMDGPFALEYFIAEI